ncbi:MAG: HAD family hydrolase [Candidatus Hodarchaeota archaeon]
MKVACLIFDVDGTIIDNTMEIVGLFQNIVKEFIGKDLSTQDILALWGPPGDEIFRNVFPSEVLDVAWKKFVRKYKEVLPSNGYFTKSQLIEMKNHVQFLTIFTGKSRQTLAITLEKLGLENIFDLILTGNDVKRSKPYPDALFQIIGILQLKKNETMFLGDSHLDIQAGRAAGIMTAAALWGSIEPQKLLNSNPDYVFEAPEDFINFVFQQKRS